MEDRSKLVYLPLFFNLTNQPCLVVGGGKVAGRKVLQLLDAGADVTIIAPEINKELKKMLQPHRCEWRQRKYISPEASAYHLVIATTNIAAVNMQIHKDCESRGIPVNVVDQPELCSAVFPSIIRREYFTIAISSGGRVPFMTKALREALEYFLADMYHLDKPELLVIFRNFVKEQAADFEVKKRLFKRLLACKKEQWEKWSVNTPPYDVWLSWVHEIVDE